jgi:hypothetical protein
MRRLFPPILDFKEEIVPVSRICARLHNSQEMQHKLEEYSRKYKMIMNQKTHKTQGTHDQKASRIAQVQTRRQRNCGGFLPLCLRANVMALQR